MNIFITLLHQALEFNAYLVMSMPFMYEATVLLKTTFNKLKNTPIFGFVYNIMAL